MRVQHNNAQRTLDRLRALHAVAIVNENDTVAANEIRFGDNDRLSALVAPTGWRGCADPALRHRRALRFGSPKKATRFIPGSGRGVISTVWWPAAAATWAPAEWRPEAVVGSSCPADAGVPVLLAASGPGGHALDDASVGTVFAPRPERVCRRGGSGYYAARSAGVLTLDDGAVRAVVKQRRSLLPAGITEVSGRFHGGDVVDLRALDGRTVARGVVAYGRRSWQASSAVRPRTCPPRCAEPAVHADDLVATW